MSSLGGLAIGLGLVFGCLLLALAAELYYLLWWKKRVTSREEAENDYSTSYAKEFLDLICWKRPPSFQGNNNSSSSSNIEAGVVRRSGGEQPIQVPSQEPDLELGTGKELLVKAIGGEESVESELMRLHNLAGPPRFLFTIKEETKEDLESEDAKSRGDRSRKGSRARSLSDLVMALDTPLLTPLASPRLKSPNNLNLDSYHPLGFNNPLFESSAGADLNRPSSSPPPKFKFLRDAEEKLIRRLLEEAEKRASRNCGSGQEIGVKPNNSVAVAGREEIKEGSFLGFIVGVKSKEGDQLLHHIPPYPSGSSQVLPLASSPTTLRPVVDQKPSQN